MDDRKLRASWLDARGTKSEAIAQELGISIRTLYRWQKTEAYQQMKQESALKSLEAITSSVQDSAQEELAVTFGWAQKQGIVHKELADLDRWATYLDDELQQTGNLKCLDRLLRIQERRAKLLGLDAIRPADVLTSAIALAQLGLLSDAKLDRIFQIYDDVPGKLAQITDQ